MLSQPLSVQSTTDINRFGMVTNGREVVFLKLNPQQPPVYAQSGVYQVIDLEEDLARLLQGLKSINKRLL